MENQKSYVSDRLTIGKLQVEGMKMKKLIALAAVLLCLLALAGCGGTPNTDTPNTSEADTSEATDVPSVSKLEAISFQDGQLYAVAYLGYEEIEDLAFYVEHYLDDEHPPVHYLSWGEYYLVIPRYPDMALQLYWNDIETMQKALRYEELESRPFILQCNASDIFADATICLTRQGETVEFSPHISLVDGAVEVGERGLDITHKQQ